MRVNFNMPKKVNDPKTSPKQKRKLLVKYWKHIVLSGKRK